MKITIYTVTDCQFSKQEKEYLAAHNLPYEEKNLETNREYLTEMLTVGNNFAGTPVTKIEKDDGQIVVLKGFTQEEFDKTLGLGGGADAGMSMSAPAPVAAPAPAMPMDTPAADPMSSTAPSMGSAPAPSMPMDPVVPPTPISTPDPVTPPAPMPMDTSAMTSPSSMPPEPAQPTAPAMPMDTPTMTPPAPMSMPDPVVPPAPVTDTPAMPAAPSMPSAPAAPQDDALNSILDSLQAKVNENGSAGSSAPATGTPPQNTSGTPNIPDPDFKAN